MTPKSFSELIASRIKVNPALPGPAQGRLDESVIAIRPGEKAVKDMTKAEYASWRTGQFIPAVPGKTLVWFQLPDATYTFRDLLDKGRVRISFNHRDGKGRELSESVNVRPVYQKTRIQLGPGTYWMRFDLVGTPAMDNNLITLGGISILPSVTEMDISDVVYDALRVFGEELPPLRKKTFSNLLADARSGKLLEELDND